MGYRIDIDQQGCMTCGICMDVCPVEALDMTRPKAPGIETGPGPGAPLPWAMEQPLQVGECIGCGICIRECPPMVMSLATMDGAVPLAERQGPIDRPAPAHDGWLPLSDVTREALKPRHDSPWGDLFRWRTRIAAGAVAGLDHDGRRAAGHARRTLPGGLPGRHRRRPLCRAGGRGQVCRRVRRRRRGQPVPVRVRLDLHGPVRGGLPPRHSRRTDRHPRPEALRSGERLAARGPTPGPPPDRARRHRRRRARRHVGRLVPGPPRLPGDGARGDAHPGRHDGHRHPRVPAAPRGLAGGAQADRRRRCGAPSEQRDGARLRHRRP